MRLTANCAWQQSRSLHDRSSHGESMRQHQASEIRKEVPFVNLAEIERNVEELDLSVGFDLIYDLLQAYGLPKSSITRLRKGSYNQSVNENERLWKGKVFYRFVEDDAVDLHAAIDAAKNDERITRQRPRFLIVRSADRLLAIDTRTETTLDIRLSELSAHAAFFMPWAGIEKAQLEQLNYADIKAAEKMAKLYDEISRHNEIVDEQDVRNLNIFFSRLLFCFFAEDTRVFDEGCFTNAIASLTLEDGSDTGEFLDRLFEVLNTAPSERDGVPAHFRDFGYVNGRLFAESVPAPTFTAKARRVVLECGTLDWSQINPDIFGSMIQAVVQPGQREGLGMHYTSVENIMKVIRPLFLDALHERFDAATTVRKLQRLLDEICEIKVFDPACGSGNFLVIAYKELRKLEHRILQRIAELDPAQVGMFELSRIKLENFYGIEIDDFAHEIAILSLWLAKHQMNVEFHDLLGVEIQLIPLRETGNIVCGNAARMDWIEVCAPDAHTYVCGNPPYLYGTRRSAEQSEDVLVALEDANANKYLDYVAIWIYKGARYVADSGARVGFVSTNSICQGKQVSLLWPRVTALGVEISFAHDSFQWSNNARGSAVVTCVVIGLAPSSNSPKRLFTESAVVTLRRLNPYLVDREMDDIVYEADRPASPRPEMLFGSMPRDGSHFQLTPYEREELLSVSPEASKFVLPFIGGKEFIYGIQRYCLWIEDSDVDEAMAIPAIADRVSRVAAFRSASKAKSTRDLAAAAHRFAQISYSHSQCIVIPRVSSEKRSYVPMGFLPAGSVASDAVLAIYEASAWLFGLLTSRIHMTWLRIVGGKLGTGFRYSKNLVYNTFPFPDILEHLVAELEQAALSVLAERERHSGQTLKELYSATGMPRGLREAHRELDRFVDSLYRPRPFADDSDRLNLLLDKYASILNEPPGEEVAESC